MKTMKKRICSILICLLVLLTICPTQAFAAGPIETGNECTLNITFWPNDKGAADVEFKLYRVASVSSSCAFTPTKKFEDYTIVSQLLTKPDSEGYWDLCNTLPGYIVSDKINEDYVGNTDETGKVSFTGLSTGLYLVAGSVYHANRTYYYPEAFMVSLPNRLEDDSWDYTVDVTAKWESKPDSESVDIEVLKVWSDSATNTHSNDSITVELYDGTELYDTQVLSKSNDWTYTWTELYGGTTWTAKEKTVPSGYTATAERHGERIVITNTLISTPVEHDEKLPQTGLLWWPVPLLLAVGILLILIGNMRKMKARRDEEN